MKEQKVMDRLMDFYGEYLKLDCQHPDEFKELSFAIHLIQGLLTTRIVRRDYPKGWPTYSNNKI